MFVPQSHRRVTQREKVRERDKVMEMCVKSRGKNGENVKIKLSRLLHCDLGSKENESWNQKLQETRVVLRVWLAKGWLA